MEVLLKCAISTACTVQAVEEAEYWRPYGCPVLGTNCPILFIFTIGLGPMDFFCSQANN